MKTFTTFIVREGQEIAVKIYVPEGPQSPYGSNKSSLQSISEAGLGEQRCGRRFVTSMAAASCSAVSRASMRSPRALPSTAALWSRACSIEGCRRTATARAQEDCYAALVWLHEHAADLGIDPSRVAVAGDSVGASLATITAAMARDLGGPRPVCQLLLYGAFALQAGRSAYAASVDPLLTPQRIDSFISAYHRPRMRRSIRRRWR